MKLHNFAKTMKQMGNHTAHTIPKPIDIIDDAVTIGNEQGNWSRTERNGRIYLERD